ncbi:MAG: metal-sensitive transcriptional regulator [Syntrophomonadaceae bacterium]|jgi:DNA-binding FrmR family transcriptional regulator|nr:metal-sensitive transcriptional regulator [Bacillota bacterium]NLM87808.1 metal-sensitive transcriptional regulator [Syntrophomonadaceae bacterium]HAA09566.1 transcriptional regulator [Syntrophomonas sp.]HQA49440.1 metal-sensitive transcriptional regulator [Syntrophomonadaceae bacterium]HQD89525.1 metal-sensitive transcriptional regulator [Syntrophomonadaceae bacterium]
MGEEDARRNILMRLRRIEGQVRGVQRMVEQEADCGEILTQVAAIKSAVNQVGLLVFENHAQDCLASITQGDSDEEGLKEIVAMMGRLIR